MVLIVVPGLRADDLARPELPALRRIVARSAFGWMNTRTARIAGQHEPRDPEEAAYLTLGAGERATAGPYARVFSPAVLQRLNDDNGRLDHPVPIGALGEMLHAAHLETHVCGNEDDSEPRRAARLIAMDACGRIDWEDTEPDQRNHSLPLEPYGLSY